MREELSDKKTIRREHPESKMTKGSTSGEDPCDLQFTLRIQHPCVSRLIQQPASGCPVGLSRLKVELGEKDALLGGRQYGSVWQGGGAMGSMLSQVQTAKRKELRERRLGSLQSLEWSASPLRRRLHAL